MKVFLSLSFLAFVAFWTPWVRGQAFNDFERAPHEYYDRAPADPMSLLLQASESGEFDFGTESGLPLVRKLLNALDIPESSQVIVFSQTSLQRQLISAENPRTMFFNEDSHLAWMPGGKVEVISFDPATGGRFFFEEPPKEAGDKVGFVQPKSCFGCHGGAATNFLPGPLARSNYTARSGRRMGGVRGHVRMGHAVPFESRWGGYFVTGAPSGLSHLGNTFANRVDGKVIIDDTYGGSRSDLSELFDPALLPRPDADIIPLMLFDHQIEAQNLLMEALYRHRHLEFETGASEGEPREKTVQDTDRLFDKLVALSLVRRRGTAHGIFLLKKSGFESDFRRNRKEDGDGASLKDFNLKDRLFENRLSYMIYSRSFEEAPQEMKNRVYSRLWDILTPANPPEGYDYFDPGEREQIVRILLATKDDLPARWRQGAPLAATQR